MKSMYQVKVELANRKALKLRANLLRLHPTANVRDIDDQVASYLNDLLGKALKEEIFVEKK